MKLDLQNIFAVAPHLSAEFKQLKTQIPEFLAKIFQREQDFYQIFDDTDFQTEVAEIKKFAENSREKYDDIVLCGIGGSALGAKVLRDSLINSWQKSVPKLHILDNIDASKISELVEYLDFSRTLFVVISKSGSTIETTTQYKFFREILNEKKLNLADHFVFIIGKSGFLRTEANRENIRTFAVPEKIGGRFSVLTAVGLVPAALLGIDLDELLAGGQNSAKKFLAENFDENPAFQLALTQFLAKKSINVLMPYSAKLKSLSDWFCQLLAESTGKNEQGLTPLPAVGVTDQHSQLQLFLDGPKDKLVIFIEIMKNSRDLPHFSDLIQAEKQGTEQALTEKGVPNITIQGPEISAKFLGELFMLFMGATAFLGELMEINAFDQPAVERGKELAREIMKS